MHATQALKRMRVLEILPTLSEGDQCVLHLRLYKGNIGKVPSLSVTLAYSGLSTPIHHLTFVPKRLGNL